MKYSLLALPLLATLACSSTHNNNPTGPTSAAIEEACAADVDSWCGPLERCSPLSMQQIYGDKATCAAREKLWCMSFLQSKDTESADQMKTCSAALAAQSCDEFYGGVTPAACKSPPGPRADGATCQYGAQCQSTHCKIARDSICGVCAQKMPAGGACDRGSDCVDLLCKSSTKTCTGLPTLDQPCTGTCSFTSGVNLTCVARLDGSADVCKQAIQAGAACDPMADACDMIWNGLTCDPTTRTCKQTATVAGPGQPCDASSCSGNGTCTGAGQDGGFVCVPEPVEGEACDPLQNPCSWPAVCVNLKCQLPTPNQCQ